MFFIWKYFFEYIGNKDNYVNNAKVGQMNINKIEILHINVFLKSEQVQYKLNISLNTLKQNI